VDDLRRYCKEAWLLNSWSGYLPHIRARLSPIPAPLNLNLITNSDDPASFLVVLVTLLTFVGWARFHVRRCCPGGRVWLHYEIL